MIFRKSVGSMPFGSPTPVFAKRKELVKDKLSPRLVSVQYTEVCLNSDSHLSKLPLYDCDKLEKDIEVGLPLEQVSTMCMNSQNIDSLDLQEVTKKFEEKQSVESLNV